MNRGDILDAAKTATCNARNHTYGDPLINLGLAGEIKYTILAHQPGRKISPAEWEALELCITKLSRIITGTYPHVDNYLDLAAYAAIAGEAALAAVGRKPENASTDPG